MNTELSSDALAPVPRTSLHELVAQRVLSHIVQHDLAAGDRIPSERELARRLAVSRTSVRQAIASLIDVGVLASRQGGGTYVVRLDLESEPLSSVAARRAHLPSVHEARQILEVPAAALAATRRTDDDVEVMQRALDLMASEIAAGEVGARGDAAFHAAVTAASKNPTLRELMARIEHDVAQQAVGGEHPTGRGVTEVGERGDAGLPKGADPFCRADHLQEREHALLHPGTAGRGEGDERQQVLPGVGHRGGDERAMGATHRTGQHVEASAGRDDLDVTEGEDADVDRMGVAVTADGDELLAVAGEVERVVAGRQELDVERSQLVTSDAARVRAAQCW